MRRWLIGLHANLLLLGQQAWQGVKRPFVAIYRFARLLIGLTRGIGPAPADEAYQADIEPADPEE